MTEFRDERLTALDEIINKSGKDSRVSHGYYKELREFLKNTVASGRSVLVPTWLRPGIYYVARSAKRKVQVISHKGIGVEALEVKVVE
jgi:hypothetical protein